MAKDEDRFRVVDGFLCRRRFGLDGSLCIRFVGRVDRVVLAPVARCGRVTEVSLPSCVGRECDENAGLTSGGMASRRRASRSRCRRAGHLERVAPRTDKLLLLADARGRERSTLTRALLAFGTFLRGAPQIDVRLDAEVPELRRKSVGFRRRQLNSLSLFLVHSCT